MLKKFKVKNLSHFKSHTKLRKIVSNTGWLFADRILRMGAGLLVGVWVARYLGTEQYGLFNYAMAFVSLFTPIFTLGLDDVVIRQLVQESSNKPEILGTTFGLKLIGGIVSVFLAVSCVLFLGENQTLTIWLVAILAITGIFRTADTIELWFQSQVQSKYTVIAKNIAYLLSTLLKVGLILSKAPLLAFAVATLAEIVLGAIGLIAIYHVKEFSKLWNWKWSFTTAKSLLRESFPLIFSGFAILIFMKIDQIMLGQMKGDSEVGIYSAAVRISELWYFIPTAIVSSVSPAIYAAKEKSEHHYYKRIGQLLRLLTYISLAISIPMTFLSKNVILMMFGSGYAEASTILAVHIWASVFVFMGVASLPWFIAEGLNHVSLGKTLLGAILNVILNFLLIPEYSGLGAAIATIASQATAAFLSNAVDKRTRKIFKIQLQSFFPFHKY
ncbi:MAG: flippase [Rivularia sp. (in: cyanobacteria)]